MKQLRAIELRPLMAIEIRVQAPLDLGGGRRLIAFRDGKFAGPDGMTGVVETGGVDWQCDRTDGAIEIDAHYVLRTEQAELIELRSTGLRRASAAVRERIADGHPIEPDEYYFRTSIRLTTTAHRLERLNGLLAISTGERLRDLVHIHIHEVL